MNFLLRVIIIGILSYFALQYYPWWSGAAIAAIVSAIFGGRGVVAFFSSLLAVMLVWVFAAWTQNAGDGGYLAGKIAEILPLGGNVIMLIIIASLLAGLTAGFGGLTGQSFRGLFVSNSRSKQGYYKG